jgi:tripartite-type tricarboxylate transporter receptor subunit TctC
MLALPAAAQTYPSRPITMIVPFPAGGVIDVTARAIAAKVSAGLGQSIVVDSRSGAAGTIAADAVAKAAPDGYTLIYATGSALTTAPLLMKHLPFDPVKSFAPVSLLLYAPYLLALNPDVPAQDVKSFVAYARANPGLVSYASNGVGGGFHLSIEMFRVAAGLEMLHVPFKGGGPAAIATIAGDTQLCIDGPSALLPHIRAGKLKSLAVTSRNRLAILPDVPALAETYPQVESGFWNGVLAPAGTPRPVIERLAAEFKKAMEHPEIVDILNRQGAETMVRPPEAFAAFMQSESAKWSAIIKQAGIKPE